MTIATKLAGLKAMLQFDNRWQLIVNRALFREPLNLYRARDIEFLEDHRLGDANGAREVVTSRMYMPFLERLHNEHSRAAWTVADFGASNGGFPLLLHLKGFVLSRVIAVEMNPKIFPRLRFNLEHNATSLSGQHCATEIELYNVAIGGARRTVQVSSFDGTGGSIVGGAGSPSQRSSEAPLGTVSVPVWLPEDVLRGRSFDLLKIDIEGAEHEIFAARQHLCLRQCSYIVMEIHGGVADRTIIIEEMKRIGFAVLTRSSGDEDYSAVYGFARKAAS